MTTASLESPSESLLSSRRPFGRALRLAAIFGALGLAMAEHVPLCPMAIALHVPCPGCGLTRATMAILRGDFAGGLHLHPLAPIVTPVVAVMLAYNSMTYVREGRFYAAERLNGRAMTAFAIVMGALMLGVWIARFFGAFGGPAPV